jgi:hypothetical protein
VDYRRALRELRIAPPTIGWSDLRFQCLKADATCRRGSIAATRYGYDMTTDRHGKIVKVGTSIRVLSIPLFLKRDLAPGEWERTQSMVGSVCEVLKIDAHNLAWVEEWWSEPGGHKTSHSIGLKSAEMEIP